MKLNKMISPSMMCADFLRLGDDLREMEACGIEYLHIDIMWVCLVPNFTLGTDYVKKLHKATPIPLDLHLMDVQCGWQLDWFEIAKATMYRSTPKPAPTFSGRWPASGRAARKRWWHSTPGTSLNVLDEVLPDVDGILIMTVNPGFAGQKLVPQTLEKIERLRAFLDGNGYSHVDIEVDGNVSFENARKMSDAGANIFVAGTSSMFVPGVPLSEGIAKLRDAIK